jgi:SAM-dependent methyltransferase
VDRALGPRGAESAGEDLRLAWDEHAAEWIRWAREPGFDTYWRFGRDAFFSMLPPPGRRTLDLGCGEGRVSRDLTAAGHNVVALDGSRGLTRAAREAAPDIPVLVADAAHLPIADAACDLVAAYMTVHDFDDMQGALRETARVLDPRGVLCLGVVHPINSAGNFTGSDEDANFVIDQSYFESRKYVDRIERDGLTMTFSSRHHTFEDYCTSIVNAGFVIDAVREVTSPDARWQRIPMFLFVRAIKR